MTMEKREFAKALGLFVEETDSPVAEQDKKTAMRYLMSGAAIPQTLLYRLERYKKN